MITAARSAYARFARLSSWTEPFALLFARIALASVFWRSGLQKVETFNVLGLRLPTPVIKDDTLYLFAEEFFDQFVPGRCFDDAEAAGCATAFFFTDAAAVMATVGELTLPLLVAFGWLTRLGALGLLAMTLVIQILVFPTFGHWINPAMWWAATALVIVARGPGALSVDRLLARRSCEA